MRIARIDLSNFRCYVDASIELHRMTVLTGPNDGGKSTLIDAVRSLFLDTDRSGLPMSWESVRHRSSDVETQPVVLPPDYGVPKGLPSYVLATIATEGLHGWSSIGEVLRLGAYWAVGAGVPHRCLLVSDAQFNEMFGDPVDWPDWLAETQVAHDQHGRWLDFEEARATLAQDRGSDLWSPLDPDGFVHVPGPDAPPPRPADVLRPLITRRVASEALTDHPGPDLWRFFGGGDFAQIGGAVNKAVKRVEEAYSATIGDYVPSISAASLLRSGTAPTLDQLVDMAIGDLEVLGVRADGMRRIGLMGAGTRRAATMAAVELYTDQELVHSEVDVAYIVLEEPEVGLHPAAQRRVARALARAARNTPHVQFIIVTHSAAFLDAVEADWIRVCKPSPTVPSTCEISEVRAVAEASKELGLSPRDALLASHVLVVEGASDAAVLSVWSETNGLSLSAARITVVPAGGYGPVEQIAKVLGLVYSSVPVTVVLDNGSETHRTKLVLEERFGERVTVTLLPETEIEALFTEQAVLAWAVRRGAPAEAAREAWAAAGPKSSKKRLQRLAQGLFGKAYDVVADGAAIAGLMSEAEIAPAVRSLLSRLVAAADEQ